MGGAGQVGADPSSPLTDARGVTGSTLQPSTEMTESARRIDWIDQARGLGIVLVVIGHVASAPVVHRWIFLFHMPFFFALSGVLARPAPPAAYVRGRITALIVPYLCYLVLVGLLDLALGRIDGNAAVLAQSGPARTALRLGFGGTELVGVYGVFWFVPCLFFAGGAFNLLLDRARSPAVIAAVALACGLLSYLLPSMKDPLGLLDVPMALFFFWLGWLAHGRRTVPATATMGALAIFVLAGWWSAAFDMKYLMFGILPLNLLAAGAGAVLVAGVAQTTGRVRPVGTVLALLGRASLVIMFLHQLVHFHLAGRLPEWAVAAAAVAIPTGAWWLFGRGLWSRRLLLGTDWRRPAHEGRAAGVRTGL